MAGTEQGGSHREIGAEASSLVEGVAQRLEAALGAADRIRVQLGREEVVEAIDIDLLAEFVAAFDAARERVTVPGEGNEPTTVADLRAAVTELERNAEDHERAVLEALAKVSRLSGGLVAVRACKEVALALSAPGALTDTEAPRLAEGLLALIRLNGSPEASEADELERVAVDALPQECIPAVGLARVGALEFELEDDGDGRAVDPVASVAEEAERRTSTPSDGGSEAEVVVESSTEDEVQARDETECDLRTNRPETEAILCQLLEERRFGLAHWVVVAAGGSQGLDKSLIAIAYGAAMRSPVGESAGRLRELVEELSPAELRGDKAAHLIALVAGLRATLLAPHSGAVGLLEAVAPSFAEPEGLRRFVEAVTESGQSGFSVSSVTLQARDLANTEDDLEAVRARARETLKLRTIKYQRASNVWRKWVSEDGLLGALLSDVVANRIDRLKVVQERVFELRSVKVLERELDATDRILRAAGRQTPITDKARMKLIEGAGAALAIAADWVDVSQRLQQARQAHESASWQTNYLDRLRSIAQEARDEIGSYWDALTRRSGLVGAAATGTRPIIDEILSLVLQGDSPEGPEQQVDEILGLDLLRVDGLEVDDRLEPRDVPRLDSLQQAVDSDDWKFAFERRVVESSFGVAARIVEVLRRESPQEADELEARRLELLEEDRRYLKGRFDEAARKMEAARRQGRLLERDALSLSNELNELALDGDEEELGGVEGAIAAFEATLADAERVGREQAKEKFESRLADDLALEEHRERFKRLLEMGEISTLEELVLAVDRGHDPPSEPAALFTQLTSFFPAVVDDSSLAQLPGPAELAKLARERGSIGTISFGELRDEEIEAVEQALEAWGRVSRRDFAEADADLTRIFDFVGLTAEHDLESRLSVKDRRSFVFNATPRGKALAPAFGSEAKGIYRGLLIWERTTDDALVGTLSQIPSEEPIVVLCVGSVLSSTVRRGIADQLRHSGSSRPVALIDNAGFLYLASRGGRDLAKTMRITLPFTAINPYTPFVAGSVPLEMFYGRHEELAEVQNPNGTCFIYGGRRLGKSALLKAAERTVNDDPGGTKGIYVDLKSNGIGEWRAADEIVDVIVRALIEKGVLITTAAKTSVQGFDLVRDHVKSWLDTDPGRRILLLLDECDSFLNADAEDGFRNVSQLKALMEETDRRFKPVFAGLHQVNRFQQLPNQPLAHLGAQMPVGPLTPQRSYELITKPMEALGYKFEEGSGLPERILTATNYQPSLIQLFCSELVKHMLDKHARGPGTPPYLVTSADVDHVHQAPHVVEEMRARFELTISLDPRYRVIAYVVALEAREGNVAAGLAPPEIRAACEEYWPEGFAKTNSDVFRSLLEEMDSLGILFKRNGTFLMRSPNVLRMLGTGEQIEERLYDAADELEITQEFEATSFRDAMGDGYRRQPLTHQQVHGMLERQQQRVHVVIGSQATGIEDVLPCLKELFAREATVFNFVDMTGQDAKRVANRFRKPAQKKVRVVHFRVPADMPGDPLELVRSVETNIFEGQAPATAIFVLGTEAMSAWGPALIPRMIDGEQGGPAPQFELIELARWTEAGLRSWAQSHEVDLPFHEKQALDEITRVTGGWPLLVDRVVRSYRPKGKWQQAINELDAWLDGAEGATALCESIGLTADPTLASAWDMLVGLGESVEREFFQELLELDPGEAATVSAVLRSLQVLDFEEGRFVAEPTAARAWLRMRAAQSDAGG